FLSFSRSSSLRASTSFPTRRSSDLLAIAIFKLVKAVLLLSVGLGALSLLDPEVMARVSHWTHRMLIDEHSLLVQKFLLRLGVVRSEEHTSELQSRVDLVCRLLLEKK